MVSSVIFFIFFLQAGTWEFESFQICHLSHTDKLFGQPKQEHVHTLYMTCVQTFVPQHQSVSNFVCLFCVPTDWEDILRSKPFVIVCAFTDVLMFLHCFSFGAVGLFHIYNPLHEDARL